LHANSIVILVLSHVGYWLAGTDGLVSFRWTIPDQTPQATLVWDLSVGSVRLDHGSIPMNAGAKQTDIKIKCPPVRARIDLAFTYRLISSDGKKELESGSEAVHAFPDNLAEGWSSMLRGKNIAVLDAADGLQALLAKAGVQAVRLQDESDLRWERPDIVLVGANQLDDSPFSQGFLIEQANAGAGILILEQSRVDRLIGHAIVSRPRPRMLRWNVENPLLADLNEDDLSSWVDDLPRDVAAVRLIADRSVTPVAGLPGEPVGTDDPACSDLLLLIQRIGRGRIILCQLRLGTCKTDPRTLVLLGNALACLSAAPPTEIASCNKRPVARTKPHVPTVLTLAGDDR
jgi:hypothetical protein